MCKNWECVQTIFFDIRRFEIKRVDCTRIANGNPKPECLRQVNPMI